jgi:hypothetical protein
LLDGCSQAVNIDSLPQSRYPSTQLKDWDSILTGLHQVMEVFMDDFSIYGKTFEGCMANLDKVLKQCQMADLVVN